jgi:hypothetical protein
LHLYPPWVLPADCLTSATGCKQQKEAAGVACTHGHVLSETRLAIPDHAMHYERRTNVIGYSASAHLLKELWDDYSVKAGSCQTASRARQQF